MALLILLLVVVLEEVEGLGGLVTVGVIAMLILGIAVVRVRTIIISHHHKCSSLIKIALMKVVALQVVIRVTCHHHHRLHHHPWHHQPPMLTLRPFPSAISCSLREARECCWAEGAAEEVEAEAGEVYWDWEEAVE